MDFARTELIVEDDVVGTGIVMNTGTLLVDGREVALAEDRPVIVEAQYGTFTTVTVSIIIDKVTMQQVSKP